MSEWLYKGAPIKDEQIPEKAIGFIYLMTQISTGKRYIGRKLLIKRTTKTVNGKKKKVVSASDWKDYWSSSPQIKEWIDEAGGTSDFTREILSFCSSKGSLVYLEELALYQMGVLESDDWINRNIRSKVYKTWCKPDEAKELRKVLSTL